MDDHFSELIVTRSARPADTVKKVLLIFATVLAAFSGLFISPIFIVALVLLGLADYFFFPRFRQEYEYSYVNGDIDIAVIYSKQNRKHLATISTENVECVAPAASHRLDSYGITFKPVDYTSGDPADPVYVIVKGGSENQKIMLHLDEGMLDDLKWRLPGKVFTD